MNTIGIMSALALAAFAALSAHAQEVDVKIEGAPMERQTYLGVHVSPATPAMAAQLKLEEGMGVVVDYVDESGPAGKAGIQRYDILLRLDDQILIGTEQIGVLVRSKSPGDRIKLTYLRQGERGTTEVPLGEKEMPQRRVFRFIGRDISQPVDARGETPKAVWRMETQAGGKRLEQVIKEVERSSAHPDFDRLPTIHAMPAERVMSWSDGGGDIDVRIVDGERQITVRDPQGNEIYSGRGESEDELARLPEGLRERVRAIKRMGQGGSMAIRPAGSSSL